MKSYVILLRGINVGGKNIMPMQVLRQCLEQAGFKAVESFLATGNILVRTSKTRAQIKQTVETLLPETFGQSQEPIKALVLARSELETIVNNKPSGFGEEPKMYHSDVIFMIDIPATEAFSLFTPKEGVDRIWAGESVVYSERLSAERTKSRLNKIMSTKQYKSMTIRTFNTVSKLLQLITDHEKKV